METGPYQRELEDINRSIVGLYNRVGRIEDVIGDERLDHALDAIKELTRIVNGDESLGVPPIRDTIEDITKRMGMFILGCYVLSTTAIVLAFLSILVAVGQ